jgi:hypothetical protein
MNDNSGLEIILKNDGSVFETLTQWLQNGMKLQLKMQIGQSRNQK